MIDLDSLHVELSKCNSQQADVVLRCIRDHILFRHGTPESINCDYARELVGKTMQNYQRILILKYAAQEVIVLQAIQLLNPSGHTLTFVFGI
jgi:hypothetical protein